MPSEANFVASLVTAADRSVEKLGEKSVQGILILDAMRWAHSSIESDFGKNEMIERRLMNQSIEPHEWMRQIKNCVDVFNR